MASTSDEPPTFRCDSPSPDDLPTPAIGACPELSRCLSTASSLSHGSSTDITSRDSLGSDISSRQSSGSYQFRRSDASFASSRQSTCSSDGKPRRRGYVRPQGTDFAASARSRESVLSLGSITHLQYYFARTGLLDGKGAQMARGKSQQQNRATLDLSALDTSALPSPKIVGTDVDSSYASMGSSPDLAAHPFSNMGLVESPIEDHDDYFSDDFDESEQDMLPPTVSTYKHREKPVPRPPTIGELKTSLSNALEAAAKALNDAKADANSQAQLGENQEARSQGWFEVQGVHILDVMTFAIRAAKLYYTAHEQPERLDAIKPEKQLRADLLSVMEVLKHMATRNFVGGMREDESTVMDSWITGLFNMLAREEKMEADERAERGGWSWLSGDWTGRETERELAFLASIDPEAESLPLWTPADDAVELPTPFLKSMQDGLRLVKLHNAAVRKSQRRFGAIPTFHTDTQKPYRAADNIRYWMKAAELRWEVILKVDALGVVYNSNFEVWRDFETAIFAWCRKVREEITSEQLL
jgi:hypothetical protein